MYVAKIKAQISCIVTAQLICAFVFTYAKIRFYYNPAHMKTFDHFFWHNEQNSLYSQQAKGSEIRQQ